MTGMQRRETVHGYSKWAGAQLLLNRWWLFFFFFLGGGGPRRSRDGWVRTPRCERVERVDSQSSIASLNGEFSGSGGWEKEKSPIL